MTVNTVTNSIVTNNIVTDNILHLRGVLNDSNVKFYEFDSSIHYSVDLSRDFFNDFISNASGECEVQKVSDSLYVLYGNDVSMYDSYYKEDELSKLSKDELLNLAELNEIYYLDCNELTRDTIITDLLITTNEDYYSNHINYDDYDYSISGYSQGDYVRFIQVGKLPDFISRDYLHHTFFDTPIDGVINIKLNGEFVEELFVGDYLNDMYTWDKELLIKNISDKLIDKEYVTLLISYIEDNLPDNLDYV